MRDNTSIIHDEVLAHRIGLVPMKIDPDLLEPFEETNEPNDLNTIVVGLEVRCKEDEIPPLDKDDEVTPGKAYTKDVLSGDLRWAPAGNQSETFNERGVEDVRPVHDDIVLTKLRPGQGVHFEAHCRRGVGKDHAKFSPSATASYRLLPEIRFENPVTVSLT
jgi:DNA-directed RNA polymerase I and III subunit RPAC1